ncbi:vancomycin aglycone glucosyltransferase [Tamaricihabitans halophyticus]|uniref:Vancomycin aglycone glucosyltransferase n=1 Tax=Tamaricihabitans halophyticus TaxID=1262583 RepID=A0A4R2RBK2_9PSEU|nr:glycosyltransferase [Tamaricihabitans halophyticus]TCP57101.1 vancomycin aglycone glucosyltransferase [Tamaricihabitans halophyticus]
MRVLLSTWGSRGDVEPLAGLALGIRELGAQVRVCAPPDAEFAALFTELGIPFVPLGPAVRSVTAGKTRPTTQDAFRLAAELVAARFSTLGAAAADCDVLLATGLMPAGARSVAEKLGIRYVFACFHPFGLPSRHFRPGERPGQPLPAGETDPKVLWDHDARRVNDLYRDALNSHRTAIGLPAVENVRDYVFGDGAFGDRALADGALADGALGDRPLLAADPILGSWQDSTELDLVQTGAWIRPDERPLPPELVEFLDAGDPPVYVGFGSMAMRSSPDLAGVAIEAARAHGRRLVLARGWAELAPSDAKADCFVVGEVNQQALFPRAAAVVHHGGAGTTTTAALAGAPQVVLPQIADQPHWARRVAELGIGAAHPGQPSTVESLSRELRTALDPETRVQARAVAGWMSTDGAAVAARLLVR